jgi:hypothetical protein
MRRDIMRDKPRDTPQDQYVSGGTPGSPTETKALTLVSNPTIARIERTLDAVDAAWRMMNQDQRILLVEKYQKGKLWPQICREQYWSESKYHRVRNGVVRFAAECMGLTK